MTSYKGLLNKIEAFCNAHLQIKKYGGEFREQMPNFSTENEKYPIVYVVPTSDLSDLNTNQFTLDVYCVDIIQKDRANINTIVSDCNLIVNDLYLYFLDGNDLSIDVIGASSGSPINNFDLDYSAGWVKSITFEVQSYSVCAIPMNPINPNPPQVCNPANYNLVDTLDNILASGTIDSGATENIVVGNSTVENSDASYSASIVAEGSLVLPDITVDVTNSLDVVVSTQISASVQDVVLSAPDGTINIKKTGDGTIHSESVPSGATVNYSVADNAITVNSTNGFSIDLTDGTSSVTPTSVTYSHSHHKVDIVLPNNAPTPRSTATLMKTGQTISYRTGDDGDYEAGRPTNFLTLDSAPLHDNGSATLNTTTNRFTDILGGQTYATAIVLDWSTWNGTTLLAYSKNYIGLNVAWNTAIDNALTTSIGSFTSGWRLVNRREMQNISYEDASSNRVLNFAPFNNTFDTNYWTSTTCKYDTTRAWILGSNSTGWYYGLPKSSAACSYYACRTMNLSTLNVLS
jgi:hypothetical protein